MVKKLYNLKKLIIATLLIGVSIVFLSIAGAKISAAAPVVGFSPGNIISDNIFTNSQSMTASQIQQFLNSKVASCDTNGTLPASEYGRPDLTHAQYAASRGWAPPPYTCLKSYSEGGRVAAQIIYDVAQSYQINPQVLIVLLQKEQGLVTDSWPLSTQYRTATGYGCPDTAPCDSQYYGLTNQLDWSAKMFRAIMNDSPTWYTPYEVGNNYIQYNPNASCGGSTVNILNRATQALYNYTPYQPNQSALNAGYGTGDSCGAYGNRNFYLYFSDWFGSPLYGNLVRTTASATVYIVSGDVKYPVDSMSMLSNFSSLGPVSFSTDSYLNSKTTGESATNLIKSESSATLYFTNAGIKLPFSSCVTAAHYGRACGSEMTLTDGQIALFSSGPNMTRFYQTTTGEKYYIENSKKREIYDSQSMQQAGISGDFNRLGASGIAHLPEGMPVIRDDVLVLVGQNIYFHEGNSVWQLGAGAKDLKAFSTLSKAELSDQSVSALSSQGVMNGFVQKSGGSKYVLDSAGKTLLSEASEWGVSFKTLSDTFIDGISNSSQPTNERFIKSNTSSTIFYVMNGKKHSITSWGDFLSLHDNGTSGLSTLATSSVNEIASASDIYPIGSLIKSPNSATVYVVTNLLTKSPLTSFQITEDYGLRGGRVASQTAISSYTNTANLSNFAMCGDKTYISNRGTLYEIDAEAETRYGYGSVVSTDWGEEGCSVLSLSPNVLSEYSFVKSEFGKTIYIVQAGKKHPIGSMAKYQSLGGNASNLLIMSDRALSTLPEGAVIN